MDTGRPTKMTPETLSKLEQAFLMGCTDLEACLYAYISKSTLYDYQNANPQFLERKESLKQNPVLKARKSVVDSLDDNPELAMKFLERKKKDEFSLKSEFAIGGSESGIPMNINLNFVGA